MEKHVQKLIRAIARSGDDRNIDHVLDILDYLQIKHTEDEIYEYVEKHYPLMIDSCGVQDGETHSGICHRS